MEHRDQSNLFLSLSDSELYLPCRLRLYIPKYTYTYLRDTKPVENVGQLRQVGVLPTLPTLSV